MAKSDKARRDRDQIRATIMDAESPLHDLRRGIGALSALNEHMSVEEAGVSWIAEKLSESLALLEAQWRELHQATRQKRS